MKSKRASGLSLGRGRPGISLDVQPQAEPFLELVVMTFVILEQLRWEQEVTTVHTSDFDDMLSTLSRRLGISKSKFKSSFHLRLWVGAPLGLRWSIGRSPERASASSDASCKVDVR